MIEEKDADLQFSVENLNKFSFYLLFYLTKWMIPDGRLCDVVQFLCNPFNYFPNTHEPTQIKHYQIRAF